ncbi:MAG: phosphoenolpyruvate carboxykinase (ATP) [Acidobacteria bacterium]|nr:phosphoenolpyruvate carboxykinase (ATP) [Acidobacteriota bacterium]
MGTFGWNPSRYGLDHHGLRNVVAHWNLPTPALYEHVMRRNEAVLAHLGPLVVRTGDHTGRSPNDKFLVREPLSEKNIWWGDINRPFDPERFDALYARLCHYLQGREVFVQDCFAGADAEFRMPIRVITEKAWHSLFARNLFIRPDAAQTHEHVPEFTILSAPGFKADPEHDGTRSSTFIIVHFGQKRVIIGGTAYAGEIKKSIFTILNYRLPLQSVLSMHCSANIGAAGDVALFFGLSGTGKTTLSTDPERRMIGDDEHGWTERGVFNFEGGCYAKVIRLSPEGEPEIYACTRKFGTILENVTIDPVTRRLDLDDDSLTENTRAAYPLTHLDNIEPSGTGGHPRNIFMLTCDAFGVLPPIARLSPAQAAYHFLAGYTAKVAGTERGIVEPKTTFSPCFGAPFMALHPSVYAKMLAEKIARHKVNCWLVNTGWTGGPYGVGQRMKLGYTRAIIRAALAGALDAVPTLADSIFDLKIPRQAPGVPSEILLPENTWQDKEAYRAKALQLAEHFHKNFDRFAADTPEEVRAAGPKLPVSR